jgi:hypothetical protein
MGSQPALNMKLPGGFEEMMPAIVDWFDNPQNAANTSEK